MPRIGLIFELQSAETRPGEMVRVVGDRAELGHWDPYDVETSFSLELRTGPSSYPRWALLAPVWIEIKEDQDLYGLSIEQDDECGYASGSDGPATPRTPGAITDCEGYGWSSNCGGEDACLRRPSGVADVDACRMVHIEYKFVKDKRRLADHGPSVLWEDSIANRRVTVPCEPGTIWVISDLRFNDAGRTPQLSRASLPEVLKRWCDLDPEWTSTGARDRSAPEWGENEPPERGELFSPVSSAQTYCSGHTTSTRLM